MLALIIISLALALNTVIKFSLEKHVRERVREGEEKIKPHNFTFTERGYRYSQ